MAKLSIAVTTFFALGLASTDLALAQQASAPATQTPAAAPTKPAAKSGTAAQSSTPPKTGAATAAKRPATAVSPLKTPKEKASYAIGMNIGKNVGAGLKQDGVDIDAASLARGVKDAIAGTKPLLTDEEAKAILTSFATEIRAKQMAKLEAEGAPNKKAGDEFLAANKTKEGVVTLPSGLQYKILKEGNGPKPTAADTVTCNYSGTSIDGKEFDSSYKRGEPASFPVGQVIKGWSEALLLMPVGSKWQLVVPSDLAYGLPGKPPVIGPNSTLVFEVELLSIAPKPEAKPAAAAPAPEAKPAEVKPPAQQ